MKLYLTISLTILAKFAFSQTILTTKQIDSVAMSIDSVKDPYFVVEDGMMTRVHKGLINKIFGKHSKGGFSTNYSADRKTKKILKIAHYATLDETVASVYYYLNDSLILVTRSRSKKHSDKKISDGRFYFWRGRLIAQTGNDVETKLILILPTAKEYLKRWQDDFMNDHLMDKHK